MFVHRPLVSVFICYVLGILISDYFKFSENILIPGGVLFAAAALLVSGNRVACCLLCCALGFLGALMAENIRTPARDHIIREAKYYRGQDVRLEGVVVSDVEHRRFFKGEKTILTVEVKRFQTSWGFKERQGKVLVNIFRRAELDYGDYISFSGKLHPPYNFSSASKFSYQDYLKQRGIHLIASVKKSSEIAVIDSNRGNFVKASSLKARKKLKNILNHYLPEDSQGIMNALLLGERYDIQKTVKELFVQTGTAHILAISGFNVGIVAFLVFLFLKILRFPRVWQYCLTIAIIIFYAFMTGAQSPVVRSTIMSTIFLSSFLIKREVNPLNSLALAGMIILLGSPVQIYDVGFQLSFVSVFFILILYPRFQKIVFKQEEEMQPFARHILQSLLVSVAASLGVTGLIALYFNIVTPVSILANLIIIPLTSLNIALGIGLLISGAIFPYWGGLFADCIEFFIQLMIMTAALLSQIPGAYFYLEKISLWMVLLYYAIVFLLINWRWVIKLFNIHRLSLFRKRIQNQLSGMRNPSSAIDKKSEL